MFRPALILAYHGVTRIAPRLDPRGLVVDPERFLNQVEVLKRRRYEFVTVSEFVGRVDGDPPPGVCALTFDDGTADQAQVLPGLLERLDVPATVYVCPGLLGRPNPFLRPDSGLRLMSSGELRSMAKNPRFEIGSHTRTHVVLGEATEAEAYEEMSASKAELEELIGKPVLTFAYPTCVYSAACPAAAARAGYVAAVTCGPRGSWRPYELLRQAISASEGRLSFELKSRDLWYPLRQSRAGRAIPGAAALLKHRSHGKR